MDIFIDFDGTIASDHSYGPPMKDAIETINSLYDKGYQIVIYSCRSNFKVCDPKDHEKMVAYLRQHGIKYHRIEKDKPHFMVLIDDRSMNPHDNGWDAIKEKLIPNGTD